MADATVKVTEAVTGTELRAKSETIGGTPVKTEVHKLAGPADGDPVIDPRDVIDRAARDLGKVDAASLDQYVPEGSPGRLPVAIKDVGVSIPTSITATASGNTTILSPALGKKVRLKAFIFVNTGSAVISVGLRFGAAGTIHFKGDLSPDGGTRGLNLIGAYIEGAINDILIINLSAASGVEATVITEEI